MTTNAEIALALSLIRPGSNWVLSGDDYSGLQWIDAVQVMPTQTEVLNGIAASQASLATETQRQSGIRSDAQRAAMLNRLKTSTNAQIDAYVSANVTNLAQAQVAIGIILKLIALDARS